MKKLSLVEWVAVAASVVFVAYMLFGDFIMRSFNQTISSSDNNAAAVGTGLSGSVGVQDLLAGTGEVIGPGMLVSVHYVLKLEDGSVIQDSKVVGGGQPFQFVFGTGQLIPGWEMGIAGMKVGGKRVITIPPELGYGSQAVGPIPANSTLVFEIEVVGAESLSLPAQQ